MTWEREGPLEMQRSLREYADMINMPRIGVQENTMAHTLDS